MNEQEKIINKISDIIKTMIEFNMIDINRLHDIEYVKERINIYLETKNFVDTNFKGCF